jgi:hypothetical protein
MPSLKKPTPSKKTPAKKATPKKVVKKAIKKVAAKAIKKVAEKETPMKVFTCKNCKQKFPDMLLYFYDTPSKKCMWCTKFPSRNITKT